MFCSVYRFIFAPFGWKWKKICTEWALKSNCNVCMCVKIKKKDLEMYQRPTLNRDERTRFANILFHYSFPHSCASQSYYLSIAMHTLTWVLKCLFEALCKIMCVPLACCFSKQWKRKAKYKRAEYAIKWAEVETFTRFLRSFYIRISKIKQMISKFEQVLTDFACLRLS